MNRAQVEAMKSVAMIFAESVKAFGILNAMMVANHAGDGERKYIPAEMLAVCDALAKRTVQLGDEAAGRLRAAR